MNHEWLIQEIAGLRDFAALNGLPRLAEALDQARLVALVELASAPGGADGPAPEGAG
jgi:hypothetical protein